MSTLPGRPGVLRPLGRPGAAVTGLPALRAWTHRRLRLDPPAASPGEALKASRVSDAE